MTTAKASKARALPPRERMVRSAAQLIRRKGVSGTGMREIVAEADAPRGSLQHYFPGGKEEIVSDALLWSGPGTNGWVWAFVPLRISPVGFVADSIAWAAVIGAFAFGTFGLGFTLGGLVFGRWRRA